jgi:heparin/heparan-sulfate lyase
MTRAFLYIKPDYFVVFDRVVTTNPRLTVSWLLHTVNKPSVHGDTIQALRTETLDTRMDRTVGGAKMWAYPMLIQAIKYNRKGRDYRPIFYEYKLDGKLFCKTLLPKEHVISVIGGQGKDFWVDGANRNINAGGQTLTPDPQLPRDVGSWRVEVIPKNVGKEHLFLHVLQVSGSKEMEMVPVEYVEHTESVGFRMRANNREYEVFLRRSGIGGHISIIRDGKTVVSKDFATEIRNNAAPF